MELLNAFASLIAFAANIIFQIWVYKVISKVGLLKSIFLGFFFGLIILFSLELFVLNSASGQLEVSYGAGANLVAYGALGYCYFHFINLGETARRVRLLRDIYDSDMGLTQKEILSKYNAQIIVEKRLSRLLDSHQIVERNGRYFIGKNTMLLITKIITAMKILVLGKRSEFDSMPSK